MGSADRALEAFRRLLADAARGGQAKVDALVALSQRTLFVATWTPGGSDFRTLTSSQSQSALPVFTDLSALNEAAARFGWLGPDGTVPHQEIGARQAFRAVMAQDLGFLLVDVTSPHELECERAEIEPLVTARARSESSGPFAGVGRISETMLQAVKPSRDSSAGVPRVPPAAIESAATPSADRGASSGGFPRPPSSGSGPRPTGFTVSDGAMDPTRPSATFGSGGSSAQIHPLTQEPSDALIDALTTFLRGFPEVEWAALCLASRGPVEPVPTVAVKVDDAYRQRVGEIVTGLRRTGDEAGASLDVLLLDDPKLMRAARASGSAFFPWRRRGTS